MYPEPVYDTIIEPFAGSARYALRHGARSDRNVILNDLDPTIYGIWKWLVEEATPERVAMWPELKVGERLSECKGLTKPERDVLGFSVQFGVYTPRVSVSSESAKRDELRAIKGRVKRYLGYDELSQPERDLMGFGLGEGRWEPHDLLTARSARSTLPKHHPKYNPSPAGIYALKPRIVKSAQTIKHWEVRNAPYWELPNVRATWFIDPPYCGPAGRYYKYNEIDYEDLAEWCRTRKGQVIVCEGAGAHWLPFRSLGTTANGSMRSLSVEKVWTNIKPTPLFDRLCGAPATFDARDW